MLIQIPPPPPVSDNKDNCEAVNKALDSIGYKMGIKIVDEFLAAQ